MLKLIGNFFMHFFVFDIRRKLIFRFYTLFTLKKKMFAPNSAAQMEPEATLPTDPIQAETCFETFTPFFTTPDSDASTAGAWRAFVHPDASPDFEVGATKEIGFTIAASHMLSWPNSSLQFSMKLNMDNTAQEWIGRMRSSGVKFMPDLKMIFDKIDLLINESPFQVITEFPRVNFVRSNILGGNKDWIRMVQGGSYIVSPDLKTNSLEMGGGQVSQKVVSQPSFASNYNFGHDEGYENSVNGEVFVPQVCTLTSSDALGQTYANANNNVRFGNPLSSFGQFPLNSSGFVDNDTADKCISLRNEEANPGAMILAPSEDFDLLDVLERGHEVSIVIPFRDLFSSLSSIQWMPGALFRRIGMRFHIRSDPEAYLLGYMMGSVASSGVQGTVTASLAKGVTGYTNCFFSPARPRIEDIHFKFTNARCLLFGQQFSPNLIAEFKSYMESKSDLQAVWYQAYMYYRVIRVLANASNNIDQNFTTISPGSAWLLSDPWYEEKDSYKQKQRILIPTVVNSYNEALQSKAVLGEGENAAGLQRQGGVVKAIRTISSFIPYAPIANKVIQRSYIAINGSEFPPTYEEQHWRLMTQNNSVHSTLGFDFHNTIAAQGRYQVGATSKYVPHFCFGSVLGQRSTDITIGDVYYPPYFEKKTWKKFDKLLLITNESSVKVALNAEVATDFYSAPAAKKELAKGRLALDRDLFYSDPNGEILAKKVRLEENYLRYLMSTGFHIDPFQSQSTMIGFEQWNTMWPILAFPIGSQDSATGAPLYEASAMTARLHLDKEQENQGISLPFYLVVQEAYLTAICADGSLVTMIGTA